jgi:hypothetical protein
VRRLTLFVALCAVAVPLASASVHLPGPAHHAHRKGAGRHHRHHVRHHRHRSASGRKPLAVVTLARLASQARRVHRHHPGRSAGAVFARLCRRWRTAHRRPRPGNVVGSVRLAATRYGLSADGMLRVARCESNLQRAAANGQYLGLFQLGSYARERYLRGDWRDAYANAMAAAQYAHEAGGWSPWTCGTSY